MPHPSHPDFLPQQPTVQRMKHMHEALISAGWPLEMLRSFCLSGRDIDECFFIAMGLYGKYSKAYVRGLIPGEFIPSNLLHDAIYSAHIDEVKPFVKEFFAGMTNLRRDEVLPALNAVQLQVVEQHAHALLPNDHPDRMALNRLLGEELGDNTARELSTCWHTDDVARVVVDIAQHHPEHLDLWHAAERRYYSVFLANAPESARTGGNNFHKCLDKICDLRGIERPKRKGGGHK